MVDTFSVGVTPTKVLLPRLKPGKKVILKQDSIEHEILIESHLGNDYWLGHLMLPVLYLAASIDNRWRTYDDDIYIDFNDSSNSYPRWRQGMFKQGDVRVGFSPWPFIPFPLMFMMDTGAGRWNTGLSLLSISGDIDYFYESMSFIGLNFRMLNNLSGECAENCEPRLNQTSGAIFHGHEFVLHSLRYGLRYSANYIRLFEVEEYPGSSSRWIHTLGIAAAITAKFSPYINVQFTWSTGKDLASSGLGDGYSHDFSVNFWFATSRSTPYEYFLF